MKPLMSAAVVAGNLVIDLWQLIYRSLGFDFATYLISFGHIFILALNLARSVVLEIWTPKVPRCLFRRLFIHVDTSMTIAFLKQSAFKLTF